MMDADGKNQKAKKTGVGFEPMINDDSKSTLSLDTAILEKGGLTVSGSCNDHRDADWLVVKQTYSTVAEFIWENLMQVST